MRRANRGWALIEVIAYGAGLAVLMVSFGGTALTIVRSHHRQRGVLTATERSGRALRLLRAAAGRAETAAVTNPSTVRFTDTGGGVVTWRFGAGRLEEVRPGANPRVWVTGLTTLSCRLRPDGLLRVAVASAAAPGLAPVEAQSLVRVGVAGSRR